MGEYLGRWHALRGLPKGVRMRASCREASGDADRLRLHSGYDIRLHPGHEIGLDCGHENCRCQAAARAFSKNGADAT
jgi:hypothetical protein